MYQRASRLEQIALCKRDWARVSGDHEVVQHPYIYELQGPLERPGEHLVGLAGLADAGWVVVGEDDGGGVVLEYPLEHFPGVHRGLGEGAPEHLLIADHPVLGVKKDDYEHLVSKGGQVEAQPVPYGTGGVEHVPLGQLFTNGAARQFHDRLELGVLGWPHARKSREIRLGGPAQGAQSAKVAEQIPGEVNGALALDPHPQEEGQQLGVGQNLGAPAEQAFPGAFISGPVGDSHGVYNQRLFNFIKNTTGMSGLKGRKLVLGVTGGVAAYKAAELVRLLGKAGADVHVVLTEGGARFVTAVTFQALSGNPVWTDLWDPRMDNNMAHIDLSRDADAILIAPATADVMARLAQGRADDLLTTLCLARDCPLLVAPAMNRQMWENPATRRNVATLRDDGIRILGPAAGEQACGEVGEGRMLEPEVLAESLEAFFQPKLLAGKRIVMTAGPTFEAIDPVRGITNSSSGKMAYGLARACAQAGAEVLLVSGPVALPVPLGVARVSVKSALEMRAAVLEALPADIFIGVAAVADYRPANAAEHKIKKSGAELGITLVPNPDILAEVAGLPNPPFCVGFAAESRNLDEYAEGKRQAKKLRMVVGNLVQDGLGSDDNQVVLFDADGRHPLPRAPKPEVAQGIVAHLARLLARG